MKKYGAKLNIIIVTTLLILAALFIPATNPEAKTQFKIQSEENYKLMKTTVRKHYGKKKIKLVNGNGYEDKYWNVILHRKNKNYIVVEKVISKSDGTGYGWYRTKDGNKYIIGYNKKVPKGRRITSYIIWSPDSNECDVIDYVVDNGKVR